MFYSSLFYFQVDDAEPLRKGALTCLLTLITALPTRIRGSDFMSGLVSGVGDKDDVKLQAYHVSAWFICLLFVFALSSLHCIIALTSLNIRCWKK